jgi:hypothetical protein
MINPLDMLYDTFLDLFEKGYLFYAVIGLVIILLIAIWKFNP